MEFSQLRNHSHKNVTVRETNFLQLAKLQQNIDILFKKNKQKYERIMMHQPYFQLYLYEPNQKLRTEITFKKQLLLKQMDKLMDQENILDKKLTQLKFIKQLEKQQIQQTLKSEIKPYTILRSVWINHQGTYKQCKDNIQRVQSLNLTIGKIRNTIHAMRIKEQENMRQNVVVKQLNYLTEHKHDWNQKIMKTSTDNDNDNDLKKKYDGLLIKFQRTQMRNQQLAELVKQMEHQVIKKDEQITKLNQQITKTQKVIGHMKKQRQIQDIQHKLVESQLKQNMYDLNKNMQKIQKWKTRLQKNLFKSKSDNFKLYIQNSSKDQTQILQLPDSCLITKKLPQIIRFITQLKSQGQVKINNPQIYSKESEQNIVSKVTEQNKSRDIVSDFGGTFVPNLNLSSGQSKLNCSIRKKMSTDRPLKNRNYEGNTFISNKFNDVSQSRIYPLLKEQGFKKFIRRNPTMTSRRDQTQNFQSNLIKLD